MRWIPNTNISSVILMPIGAMVLLFMLFVGGTFFAIKKLYTEHNDIYSSSIPELADISFIADEFKTLQANVYDIFQENEEIVFSINLEVIKERLETLHSVMENKRENELFQTSIHSILKQMQDYKSVIDNIENYVLQNIEITRQRQTFIRKLRYLNEQLSAYESQNVPQQHLVIQAQKVITELLIFNGNTDIFYGVKLQGILEQRLMDLKVAEKALQEKQEFASSVLGKTILELLSLTEGRSNILTTFFMYENNLAKKNTIKIHLDVLYGELNQETFTILEQTRTLSDNYSSNFMKRIENILIFIVITFAVIFVCVFLVYKALSNYVINPLVYLNKYLKSYTNQHECEMMITGAEEVREISYAVCNFAEQLEDRERKLIDSRDNLENLVEKRTEEISELSEKLIVAQEEERFRLAAELHDDIGASMGVVKLSIERASKLLERTDVEETKSTLDSAVQIIKSVTRQLRRIQTDLRPPHLNVGLIKTLEWYVMDYRVAHPQLNLKANFVFDELLLSSSLRIVTFRIIQEAMNNISKHSGADEVFIDVSHADGFTISIKDNGKGFILEDFESNKERFNHGIQNIRERVTVSGGSLQIITGNGKGTTVIAHWKMK